MQEGVTLKRCPMCGGPAALRVMGGHGGPASARAECARCRLACAWSSVERSQRALPGGGWEDCTEEAAERKAAAMWNRRV